MKRTLKALGLALAAAATLCACSSCYWKGCDGIDERGLKTQGYFHFYEYEDHVKIRNFSAAGKELEICYVPAQLNGKDVTAVGYQIWISADCRLQSETLKYLNLPYCVREITDFCEVPLLETLVFSSTSPVFFPGNFPTDFLSVERVKIYVPRGCTAAYQSRNDGFDFCEANIRIGSTMTPRPTTESILPISGRPVPPCLSRRSRSAQDFSLEDGTRTATVRRPGISIGQCRNPGRRASACLPDGSRLADAAASGHRRHKLQKFI